MVTGKILLKCKRATEDFFLPLVKLIAKIGISPNTITLLSFISGIVSVYALFNNIWLFIVSSAMAILLDIIDGHLARYLKKTTKLGYYLDQANDRAINFLLILKYNLLFNQLWITPILFIIHYSIFFTAKTKSVIYVRAVTIIFFALGGFISGFSYYGMLVVTAMLIIGIIMQIIELIKERLLKRDKRK